MLDQSTKDIAGFRHQRDERYGLQRLLVYDRM